MIYNILSLIKFVALKDVFKSQKEAFINDKI